MLKHRSLSTAIAQRSRVLKIGPDTWDQLDHLYWSGKHDSDFDAAYRNGQAFLAAKGALAGRRPRLIEWTGGRRASGDEAIPIDLEIDHVYLVSCKYLSANIANPSPGRLFDGLLATTGDWYRGDWYELVASREYQDLYKACRRALGMTRQLPPQATRLSNAHRRLLEAQMPPRGSYPDEAQEAYRRLCSVVSARSATRWRRALKRIDPERMTWRLLRITSAPYFLLGTHGSDDLRIRLDTPWTWHRCYRLKELEITAAKMGQPRVNWTARYSQRGVRETLEVRGHVEIRWSHGRFGQPPEAKIYLDTKINDIPGYNFLI